MGKHGFRPGQITVAGLDARNGKPATFEAAADRRVVGCLTIDQPHGLAIAERYVQIVISQRRGFLLHDVHTAKCEGAEHQGAVPHHAGLELVPRHADVLDGMGHRLPALACLLDGPFGRGIARREGG